MTRVEQSSWRPLASTTFTGLASASPSSRCPVWTPYGGFSTVALVEPTADDLREWEADFEAAARRPLRTGMRYAFISTYRPVLDDARYRSFDWMAEYRAWCEANLPSWLGYGREV